MRQQTGAFQIERGRKQRRCQRVVRRDRAERSNAPGVAILRAPQQVFEFANLVAAIQLAGQVVALDQD